MARSLSNEDKSILLSANNNGYYRPGTSALFKRALKLVRHGHLEPSDVVPGAYRLTDGGEKLVSNMEHELA